MTTKTDRYKATLPPASLLVYYAALLPVGLAYATAAYAYGKPMQAQNKQFEQGDLLYKRLKRLGADT